MFLNIPNILFSNSILIIGIFGFIFILNYILFLPKKRQLKELEKYQAIQDSTKDLFVIILSVFSISLFLSVITIGKSIFK